MAAPLLLRLLAMQPELILNHLVGAPTALLRLAQTCRTARDLVMHSASLWRDVCAAHNVYYSKDEYYTNAGHWAPVRFAKLTASEAREHFRRDWLFFRGKFGPPVALQKPRGLHFNVSELFTTERFVWTFRDRKLVVYALTANGASEPMAVTLAAEIFYVFPLADDAFVVVLGEDSATHSHAVTLHFVKLSNPLSPAMVLDAPAIAKYDCIGVDAFVQQGLLLLWLTSDPTHVCVLKVAGDGAAARAGVVATWAASFKWSTFATRTTSLRRAMINCVRPLAGTFDFYWSGDCLYRASNETLVTKLTVDIWACALAPDGSVVAVDALKRHGEFIRYHIDTRAGNDATPREVFQCANVYYVHLVESPFHEGSMLYILVGDAMTLLDPFTARVYAKHTLHKAPKYERYTIRGRLALPQGHHPVVVAVDWLTGEERELPLRGAEWESLSVVARGTILMYASARDESKAAILRRMT